MASKFEREDETFDAHRDNFKNFTDVFPGLSEIWDQSYCNEFYTNWMDASQNSFGNFSQTQMPITGDTLEKLVKTTEESNKICMSWINEFGENAKKTAQIMTMDTDPAKNRECLNSWKKSCEKISEELLALPAANYQKEIFENISGVADPYSESFERTAKSWKESFERCDTWFESMDKLSESITKPSKESIGAFQESIDINLNLYKEWGNVMEKMAGKFKDMSRSNADPEVLKEFFNLWLKMYEKSTDDFFERMPAVSPMKEMMEPVRNACNIYSNTYIKVSKMWFDSYIGAAKTGTL